MFQNLESKWLSINLADYQRLCRLAIKEYGLPRILNELAFYFELEKSRYEVKLTVEHLDLVVKQQTEKETIQYVNSVTLSPNYIYSLCKILSHIQNFRCDIASAEKLAFTIDKRTKLFLSKNAIPGPVVQLKSYSIDEEVGEVQKKLGVKFGVLKEQRKKIPSRSHNDVLVDRLGVINQKISSFCKANGIVFGNFRSLKDILESRSNDYSTYEELFEEVISSKLIASTGLKIDERKLPVPTIIIPAYNSKRTIGKVLLALASQNLRKEIIKKMQVIVVDDGSVVPVERGFNFNDLPFRVDLIRFRENRGLSVARNTGISLSKNDFLVFVDSDIVLAKNYLKEMLTRIMIIPNAVFLSLKTNMDADDGLLSRDAIERGIEPNSNLNDKRILRPLSDSMLDTRTPTKSFVEMLAESHYFKNLGFGTTLGTSEFNLQSMVVGHNMVMTKTACKLVGGFSEKFRGWGLEDTYFGARLIANGYFVIPVISTSVYHISHPVRLKSNQNQIDNFRKNYKVYSDLLNEKLDHD